MANQSPQNRPNGNNNNDNRNGDRRRFSILTIVIIAVAVTLLFNSLLSNVFSAGEKQVTYNAFLSAVETDAIAQVEIQSDRIQFLRRDEMALPKSQRTVYYTGLLPNVDLTSLISTLEDNQVEFSGEIVENSTFTFLFSWVLFPLLMLALLSLLMRFIISRSGGGAGGFGAIGSIGKSKAKVYMEKETGVTFRDVAGQDEAKESLVEIIDFLHNPQKYAAIGAKLPKGALQKHTQPVSKITIVPHTSGALGYTMQMPEEEKYLNSRDELLVELRTMLGGRAAEQTVFGIETTGASNDIERATDLARKMVMQYGMSDRIGLMALTTKGNEYLDGQSYTDCAQTTAAAADEEVRKLLNDSYDQAKKILTENRGLLDEVALYLLQKETITGDELMQYVDADKRLRGSKQETLPEAEA